MRYALAKVFLPLLPSERATRDRRKADELYSAYRISPVERAEIFYTSRFVTSHQFTVNNSPPGYDPSKNPTLKFRTVEVFLFLDHLLDPSLSVDDALLRTHDIFDRHNIHRVDRGFLLDTEETNFLLELLPGGPFRVVPQFGILFPYSTADDYNANPRWVVYEINKEIIAKAREKIPHEGFPELAKTKNVH